MGNSRSSKSSTSSRNNNNMTTTTATTTSATTPTTPTYIRRAYHAGSWYSDDPAGLERTLNKYMDDASNDLQLVSSTTKNDNGNNNNNDNGQGQGGQSGQGQGRLRAIICPHAGYRYSGPTAAYSYYSLQEELLLTRSQSQSQKESSSDSSSSSSSSNKASKIRHIVVFHPSHHYYLNGCAVSNASTIETPIGNLQVLNDLREEILALNNNDINNDINSDINNDNDKDNAQQQQLKFTTMTQSVDEAEHSGEMQYPFLALVLKNTYGRCLDDDDNSMNVSVLPIMCGNIDVQQEVGYGRLLSPIINRPDVFCIVSTDFCHYGRRFQYQPTPSTLPLLPLSSSSSTTTTTTTTTTTMELYQYITQLDHEGMRLIELQKPGGFADYLKRTKNTICGRHAVQTWLNGVVVNGARNESSSNDGSGGSGGGGGGGNPTLQVKFIKYAQSSQLVRSAVNDSSVSYASATARLVLNE